MHLCRVKLKDQKNVYYMSFRRHFYYIVIHVVNVYICKGGGGCKYFILINNKSEPCIVLYKKDMNLFYIYLFTDVEMNCDVKIYILF